MRQHLGEQLEEIARFCRLQGKEAGYRLIIEVLTTAVRTATGYSVCITQDTIQFPMDRVQSLGYSATTMFQKPNDTFSGSSRHI